MQKLDPVAEARLWLEDFAAETESGSPMTYVYSSKTAERAARYIRVILEYAGRLEKELAEKTDILRRGGV